MVQSIEAFCQRVQLGLTEATFEQKRQLIELLIDRVVVTDEEVEIRYVIPPSSKHLRFCQLRLDYFLLVQSLVSSTTLFGKAYSQKLTSTSLHLSSLSQGNHSLSQMVKDREGFFDILEMRPFCNIRHDWCDGSGRSG